MKFQQHKTEPAVRTVIKFSYDEVALALIDFAKKHGFTFTDEKRCLVWFPNLNDSVTKLVIDCDGVKGAIQKPSAEEENEN